MNRGVGARVADALCHHVFGVAPRESHVDFNLAGGDAAWYALVVEDQSGHKAYTNPIWVAPALARIPHKVPGK